jgi:phage-related minor tail protein
MNYKKLKKELHKIEREFEKVERELEHKEDLFKSAVSELTFSNTQVAFLMDALYEIEKITKDPITKQLAKQATEKKVLLELHHARDIFNF